MYSIGWSIINSASPSGSRVRFGCKWRMVVPVGIILDLEMIVQGHVFTISVVIIDLPDRDAYPLLLGRPWLRFARMKHDWQKMSSFSDTEDPHNDGLYARQISSTIVRKKCEYARRADGWGGDSVLLQESGNCPPVGNRYHKGSGTVSSHGVHRRAHSWTRAGERSIGKGTGGVAASSVGQRNHAMFWWQRISTRCLKLN
jgi:hypothetical protein